MTDLRENLADVAEVAIDNVHDMDVTLRDYADAAAQAILAALPDRDAQDATIKALVEALEEAIATIADYVDYEHDGDPWTEDARAMGEMDIDDYAKDGRLTNARAALAAAKDKPHE